MEPLLPTPPHPTHAADWRLAQLARRQHPTAWMELVRAAQGVVMALLVRHVQPQEREDLFQDVFLRIHKYLDTYRGESALSTWVYQVTMNVIRTHWTDTQRRRTREVLATDWQSAALGSGPEDAGEERWDVPMAPGQEPEQEQALAEAERQSALSRLRRLIADLKPLDRQVLFLRDVDGCPYEEIAARLQVPMGTVKSRLARARGHLAQALQGQRTPETPAGPPSRPRTPGRAPGVLPVRKA